MPRARRRNRRDPAEARQEVKDLMGKLEGGISEMLSSEGWANWLRFQSVFHNYSWGNTMLIMIQCPGASRVAGFHTWKKLNRNVVGGSKSIRILAPRGYTRTEEDANGDEIERKGMYFRAVGVFDVSQTEGDDLPDRPYGLSVEGDEDNGLFTSLKAFSEANGCPVSVETIDSGALGYYMPREHRIVVKEGMSVARMAHVLAHEVGHSMLHKGDEEADGRNPAHLSRGSKELEAESVSFILCNAFGIDPGTSSFGYIADWSGKETRKELSLSAERIAKTAKEILGNLDATKGDES